jgi:hypothetical protein
MTGVVPTSLRSAAMAWASPPVLSAGGKSASVELSFEG